MNKAAIIDIDGTLSNITHRLEHALKKDWDAFQQLSDVDPPIQQVIDIVQALHAAGWLIVICTGRNERYRSITKAWLQRHGVPHSKLYMRQVEHETLSDVDLKRGMLNHLKLVAYPHHNFELAIEDRCNVVEMWRSEGLLCLQTQKGAY